jgi:symplekin
LNEGVRIACVKFIEKVIATQTPGIKDPRVHLNQPSLPSVVATNRQLADKSDISSTIVPLNHPIIHIPALEAESQGFLDRLLSILQDKPMFPPPLFLLLIKVIRS